MNCPKLCDYGVLFFRFRREDRIGMIHADHGPVGRNHLYRHFIDLFELERLRCCGPGHSADLWIQRHQMPQGDRAQDHSLTFLGYALLNLDRSVESGRPAPVLRDAALEFVDHFYDAVLHHVIHVAAQKHMGVQRILHGSQ